MLLPNISRRADRITATAVLKDSPVRDTLDLGVHGNLNVYLYLTDNNAIAQVALDMDKNQAFGFADEILDALKNSGATFDPTSLTKSELTHLIARMRARA